SLHDALPISTAISLTEIYTFCTGIQCVRRILIASQYNWQKKYNIKREGQRLLGIWQGSLYARAILTRPKNTFNTQLHWKWNQRRRINSALRNCIAGTAF